MTRLIGGGRIDQWRANLDLALTLPDDDPETTRKRKEAEKVRMWENSLAADDDESF